MRFFFFVFITLKLRLLQLNVETCIGTRACTKFVLVWFNFCLVYFVFIIFVDFLRGSWMQNGKVPTVVAKENLYEPTAIAW